jgi:hypothetical protein
MDLLVIGFLMDSSQKVVTRHKKSGVGATDEGRSHRISRFIVFGLLHDSLEEAQGITSLVWVCGHLPEADRGDEMRWANLKALFSSRKRGAASPLLR